MPSSTISSTNSSSISMNSISLDKLLEQENRERNRDRENTNGTTTIKLFPSLHAKLRKLLLKSESANITNIDPIVKGTYLGNVVTTWAKGDGSLERPASALWKNHIQGRGSIRMNIKVSRTGLRAETREHGLTEYWNNRLTWCGVPKDYPKLFCWIYRHEGRKLKQELRCHAILCTKEESKLLSENLRYRLAEALFDFRKEKIQRQNARLSSLENYLNYYANSAESLSNYKKERTSPSKLSIIEELVEEPVELPTELRLVPELSGIDKVIHLLEMDLRPDEYSTHKKKSMLLPSHSLSSSESGSTDSNDSSENEECRGDGGSATNDEQLEFSSNKNSPTTIQLYQQICYEI